MVVLSKVLHQTWIVIYIIKIDSQLLRPTVIIFSDTAGQTGGPEQVPSYEKTR